MDAIIKFLKENGPCLSTDLTQFLAKHYGLTPVAARQRVSRQRSIFRLDYLKLPRNAQFVYLQKQYNSQQFWDVLEKTLLEISPAYGDAIAALRQRGGLMLKPHFFIACGSPLRQTKHLSPQTVLDRLVQAGLLQETNVPGIGPPCVARAHELGFLFTEMIQNMRARLIVEDITLKAVADWARRLGLVSYDLVKMRNETEDFPLVSTFAWDFAAPSYLGGLIGNTADGKAKPGYFVCDIVLDHEITVEGIKPFIHKCKTLRSLKNVGRCIQIFLAGQFSKDAFQLAKSEGVIPATPETLFGREVGASLRQLSAVLRQVASLKDATALEKLFDALGRIEGAANNLRGALFEFWAAEVVRKTYPDVHISMNHLFTDENNRRAEVDVQASVASREIRFYECKGYQPGGLIPDEEVDAWLDRRVPLVYRRAQTIQEWQGRGFHFEFWSTGRLSDASIERIEKARATIRPGRYTLDYYDAERLITIARDTKDKALINTLHQHFLNHPIAVVQRAEDKRRHQENTAEQEENQFSQFLF